MTAATLISISVLSESKNRLLNRHNLYYNTSIRNWNLQKWTGVRAVPEISLFYGIRVTMYYNDHMPPHFHAEYNGQKALVDINNI